MPRNSPIEHASSMHWHTYKCAYAKHNAHGNGEHVKCVFVLFYCLYTGMWPRKYIYTNTNAIIKQ